MNRFKIIPYVFVTILVFMQMSYTQTVDSADIVFTNISLEIHGKVIPSIFAAPKASNQDKLVFLLHGFASNKESNTSEIKKLAEAGYNVLAFDAPHHGQRDNTKLNEIQNGDGNGFVPFMLDVVIEQSEEVSGIIDHYIEEGYKDFAAVGVSMGGISTYHIPTVEPRINHIVPVLGSPDWRMFGDSLAERYKSINPAEMNEKYENVKVLSINAGKDVNVPSSYSEHFIAELQNRYDSNNYTYIFYPESEHFMRGEDWEDLWIKVIKWLDKNF